MKEYQPFRERLKREADFIVDYEQKPCKELKSIKLAQGMRVDFLYEGDDPWRDGVHMIWPELLDKDGNVIKETRPAHMAKKGIANMWIIDEERRPIHAKRIKMGTKGYWVRGSFRLANVTVIKVGSLMC